MKRYSSMDELKSKYVQISASGCWVWGAPKNNTNRYGSVQYQRKKWKAHRLFYTFFKGEIPKGLYVCHSCDNPFCVNPEHLFLGTQADNMRDMRLKGRSDKVKKQGSANGRAKLTSANVIAIRSSDISHNALARTYGVNPTTIASIRKNMLWGHL